MFSILVPDRTNKTVTNKDRLECHKVKALWIDAGGKQHPAQHPAASIH